MQGSNPSTLLLVEDEALLAMMGQRLLEKYGYRVVLARDGETAVQIALGDMSIDLILMDINLGNGIDGTQAAEEILKARDIPILFLSSHTEQDIVEKTEKISSYGYVVKNSSITVLDASIKMALKLYHAHWRVSMNQLRRESILTEFNEVMALLDADFAIKYASPNVERLFGIQSNQLLGTAITESIHPDDVSSVTALLQSVLLKPGQRLEIDCRYRSISNEYREIDLHVNNLLMDTNVGSVLVSYHAARKACQVLT